MRLEAGQEYIARAAMRRPHANSLRKTSWKFLPDMPLAHAGGFIMRLLVGMLDAGV